MIISRAQRFGPSSEKDAAKQVLLFNEAEALEAEIETNASVGDSDGVTATDDDEALSVADHTRCKRGRKPLRDALPRVDVIHDLSEADKV